MRYFNGETRGLDNPFAEYESLVDTGQDVVQDLVDFFWDFPLAFQMLLHRSHPEFMIDLFAGRLYGEMNGNEAVTIMRRMLARRGQQPMEAGAA